MDAPPAGIAQPRSVVATTVGAGVARLHRQAEATEGAHRHQVA